MEAKIPQLLQAKVSRQEAGIKLPDNESINYWIKIIELMMARFCISQEEAIGRM